MLEGTTDAALDVNDVEAVGADHDVGGRPRRRPVDGLREPGAPALEQAWTDEETRDALLLCGGRFRFVLGRDLKELLQSRLGQACSLTIGAVVTLFNRVG